MRVTFCLQKGAEITEKSSGPGPSFPHSTSGPSRAAGLVSQPWLPTAPWHNREFTGTIVLHLALLWLLQALILAGVDSVLAVFHLPPSITPSSWPVFLPFSAVTVL